MKILSLLLMTLFLGKGCDAEQQQDLATAVVEYTATTRGFYRQITIKDKQAMLSTDRNNGIGKTIAISESDWKNLVAAFQEIDLEGISGLKSPTEKRFYDGAAIAQLKITYQGKTYMTADFDHGYPPIEIEKLVAKINELAPQK